MAEQLLSCEHPTSRNPSSKKQGNKPARTAGKRPVRQLRYLRLTIFDSLWRLCVSFFLSVARRRLQQFAASFRQPPHACVYRNRILNRRSKLSVHCRSSSTSAAEALYKLSSGCRLQ